MVPLIMAIDDNPEVTNILSLMLSSRGYEVVTAEGGAEALGLMEERRPDLILCDIMMPEMDGFEVFRRVREHPQWRILPFVFLTARSDMDARTYSRELGVEAYIMKPFDRGELIAVINGLLRRAEELQSYSTAEMDTFKSQFLFMITHELNTPLSVVRMLTENLRQSLTRMTEAQVVESLELQSESVARLSSIVESMLLALQIDTGRAQQLFDTWAAPQLIGTLVNTVVRQAGPLARGRQVIVMGSGLDGQYWVMGHQEQLQQIFRRILDNAIRFSPRGERVLVTMSATEELVEISFKDRGPGMGPDEIDTAFARLHQVNREQQEQQGVGLSLNLSRALALIHGGDIRVVSAPGAGSTFTVILPRCRPPL